MKVYDLKLAHRATYVEHATFHEWVENILSNSRLAAYSRNLLGMARRM